MGSGKKRRPNGFGRERLERLFKGMREKIRNNNKRSAWSRGVAEYAVELLDGLEEAINDGWFDPQDLLAPKIVRKALLNGAEDWNEYSWAGDSLIYDGDIAERLCTPSELERNHHGRNNPCRGKQWMDIQAIALRRASRLVEEEISKTVSAQLPINSGMR